MATVAVQVQALTKGLPALNIERRRGKSSLEAVKVCSNLRLQTDKFALKSAFYNGGSAIAMPQAAGAAPPRITMKTTTKGAYICRDCGYIYNDRQPFEKLSSDYSCPVCAAPKRRFKPYDSPVGRNANDTAVRKARKEELKKLDSAFGVAVPWVYWRRQFIEGLYRGLGLESKLIEIDNGATTIHCWAPREPVASKPSLMLIQGFGMDGAFGWDRQVFAFSRNFNVYVPDLLFFGQSYTTRPERSENFQADCLKNMLDILEVDQVNVVGTSYGGMVAYRLASAYPERVKKVVVASSGVMMDHQTNQRLYKLTRVNDVKQLLVPTDLQGMRRGMSTATVWRVDLVPDLFLADLFQNFYRKNRKEKKELLDGMIISSVDAPPVPVIDKKVLILWGSEDRIFDKELAHQLQRHLGANARLVFIKGAGHVPQIEKPREFNYQALQFLLS
ncbi:hypothetical protein R1flu_014945 [Riccia fluitans]|uniref:Rubredoxin-like domain-containing protein n=1 Tax=Riccia fluitans TaxID=41844 RepID=A0ABD1YHI4_9MARC